MSNVSGVLTVAMSTTKQMKWEKASHYGRVDVAIIHKTAYACGIYFIRGVGELALSTMSQKHILDS